MARYAYQFWQGVEADPGGEDAVLVLAEKPLAHVLLQLVNADREQLKIMEERNANLERDVRRYEERRTLERRVCNICRVKDLYSVD